MAPLLNCKAIFQVVVILVSPRVMDRPWNLGSPIVEGVKSDSLTSPWNITLFSGCNQCSCVWKTRTIDCSTRLRDSKLLPDANSLPHHNVRIFNFNGNGLKHVQYDYFWTFSNLEQINGNDNFIDEPFLLPPSIHTLRVQNNSLQSFSGFLNYSIPYKSLRELYLGHNNITVLHRNEFVELPNLQTLELVSMKNGIQEMHLNCIRDLPSLTSLILSDNKIDELHSQSLRNLSSPNMFLRIRFDYNKIEELKESFLDLPHLKSLFLSHNHIRLIHPEAFRSTPLLGQIYLDYNNLTRIERGTFFYTAPFVMRLYLQFNKLDTISGDIFRPNVTIGSLSLLGNSIRVIDETVFTTAKFWSLQLSANPLTRFPVISTPLQQELTYIMAIKTNVTVIEGKTFQGLSRLKHLYLMDNEIDEIEPHALDNLPNLKDLNLLGLGNSLRRTGQNVWRGLKNTTVYLHCAQLPQIPYIPDGVIVKCKPNSTTVPIEYDCEDAKTLFRLGFECETMGQSAFIGPPCVCTKCRPGTTAMDSQACRPCPRGGWYQDEPGQAFCKPCVNGTLVWPNSGVAESAADCNVCPTGTDTKRHAGYRACHCLPGYYRLSRFGPCTACNTTSPGLQCEQDYAAVGGGYWWNWNQSTALLQYRAFVENLKTYNDSYSFLSTTFNSTLPLVYKCPRADSCKGGIGDGDMCREGYRGPLCAVCARNYFSWFSSCQACPARWRTILQLFLTIFTFFLLMVLIYWLDRRKHKRNIVDRIAGKVKIVIGFIQVMTGVITALSYIPWPRAVLEVGSKLKLIGLNLVEVANPVCLSNNLRISGLSKPIVNVSGQVGILFVIFGYYQIRHHLMPKISLKHFGTTRKQLRLARRACFRNAWWVLFLCFPSSSAQVMATMPYRPWTCVELCQYEGQSDCEWRLKADLSIVCDYHGSYAFLWIICWCLVTYVLLLPVLLMWGLFIKQKAGRTNSSHEDEDTDGLEMLSLRECNKLSLKTDILESLTFLDENYKKSYWYWELTEILRKFLLTCGVEYYGSGSLSGVAIAALIANLFLLLHAQFKPIKRKSEHWLQLVSLLVVSLNLMMATLVALQQATSTNDSKSSTDRTTFAIILFIVNGFFLLFILAQLLLSIWLAYKAIRSSNSKLSFVKFLTACITNGALD